MVALTFGSFAMLIVGFCFLCASTTDKDVKYSALFFGMGMIGLILQAILPMFF